MGEVYLAEDPQIERRVAIKTVVLDDDDEKALERKHRMLREARAAGRLMHPHVVTLFDAGEEDDLVYLAFEYVEGRDLRSRLRRLPPLSLAEALRIVRQTASALAAAHRHQIVHRDIKPGNILLTSDGDAKVGDFGVAKISGQRTDLTTTGAVIGSPQYMSPEQVRGDALDGRTDQFSLGAVLYEILTGERAFEADTITTLVYQILNVDPRPVTERRPDLPANVVTLVSKMMAKKRTDRYETCDELVQAVRELEARLPRKLLNAEATGSLFMPTIQADVGADSQSSSSSSPEAAAGNSPPAAPPPASDGSPIPPTAPLPTPRPPAAREKPDVTERPSAAGPAGSSSASDFAEQPRTAPMPPPGKPASRPRVTRGGAARDMKTRDPVATTAPAGRAQKLNQKPAPQPVVAQGLRGAARAPDGRGRGLLFAAVGAALLALMAFGIYRASRPEVEVPGPPVQDAGDRPPNEDVADAVPGAGSAALPDGGVEGGSSEGSGDAVRDLPPVTAQLDPPPDSDDSSRTSGEKGRRNENDVAQVDPGSSSNGGGSTDGSALPSERERAKPPVVSTTTIPRTTTVPAATGPYAGPVHLSLDSGLALHFDVEPRDARVSIRSRTTGWQDVGRADTFAFGGASHRLQEAGEYWVRFEAPGRRSQVALINAQEGRSVRVVRHQLPEAVPSSTNEVPTGVSTDATGRKVYKVQKAVSFAHAPRRARVLVDGQERGKAGQFSGRDKWLELSPGTYSFELVDNAGRKSAFTVVVSPEAQVERRTIVVVLR